MELRLQEFIESVETLADIRNLDSLNPIVFQLEYPVTASRFTVVGSKVEPSYLGLPVNTTWVVLDPQSQYYRMALKMVDTNDPDQATTFPPMQSEDGNVTLYWNIIRTYDEIFKDAQYYLTGGKGPKGDKGDPGQDGVVDYNLAIATLAGLTGTLAISGNSTIAAGGQATYTVAITEAEILEDGTITPPATRQVATPVFLIGQVPAGTYMDSGNVLHVGNLQQDTTITLHATYPSWAKSASTQKTVTLQAAVVPAPYVTGTSLSGSTSINSGTQTQYTVNVNWSDGTVTHPAATWSLNSANFGSISANGLLTVPQDIAASGSVNVSASFVVDNVTYTPNQTVVVTKVAAPPTVNSVTISGPSALDSGTTGQFSAQVDWSDGSTTYPTASWALSTSQFGSINSSGLMTVPNSIAGSGNVTVTGTVVVNGSTYQGTKSVAVTKIPATVTSVVISGASSVNSSTTAQYNIVANWSDGSTTNPTGATWSLDSTAFGSISTDGLLTVPGDIAASGSVTVSANVTVNGQAYTPTKAVTVTLVVTPTGIAPFYGTGPVLPSDWSAFVNGLTQFGALTVDGKYQVSIDVVGGSTYMYFAYPASHGEATFYDKLSQFFGGMGGAGNASQGPSAASLANFKDMPVTVDVTISGSPVSFYVYRSDFANLGVAAGNQWEVTLTTP